MCFSTYSGYYSNSKYPSSYCKNGFFKSSEEKDFKYELEKKAVLRSEIISFLARRGVH